MKNIMLHQEIALNNFITIKPSELNTEQKLSLLEAMGIPVDDCTMKVYTTGNKIDPIERVTLREYMERGL